MSERFGIDWYKQDARRMIMFMHIMKAEAKEQERQSKQKPQNQTKFRPRM